MPSGKSRLSVDGTVHEVFFLVQVPSLPVKETTDR